ncbi:MAG: hypothetical protein LBL30_00170 [Holosporales bacterium]|jgi:hypothetical protein|nr:hypothetical protein [Holosporales bacterium]
MAYRIFPISLLVFMMFDSSATLHREGETAAPFNIRMTVQPGDQEINLRSRIAIVTDEEGQEQPTRMRTLARWGFINKAMRVLVKILYPLEGLGQFVGWAGATVSAITTPARDYFPELTFIADVQKVSLLASITGGLIYAGAKYAVTGLEKELQEFDAIRQAEQNALAQEQL